MSFRGTKKVAESFNVLTTDTIPQDQSAAGYDLCPSLPLPSPWHSQGIERCGIYKRDMPYLVTLRTLVF